MTRTGARAAKRLGALAVAGLLLPAAMAGTAQAQPAMAPGGSQGGPAAAGAAGTPGTATVSPTFTIWDVKLGQPVSQIPDQLIVNTACGTNGGPISLPLKNFSEFAKCSPESSGLREVHFEYDDEQTYIAKALDLEYRYLQAGTSVYAHPVNVSVLVDDKGIARGIRIITDDTASIHDRRGAYQLEDNLKGRYQSWNVACQKIPPTDGEQDAGGIFVHDICVATDPASGETMRLEARYLRRKGQVAIDPETQKVQRDNFVSTTRFELVQAPYTPSTDYATDQPAPPMNAEPAPSE